MAIKKETILETPEETKIEPVKITEKKIIQLGDNAGWQRQPAKIQLGK